MLRCLLPLLLVGLTGCAFLTPRFSQNVQASFARDDMRKLTTRSLELYYPASHRPAALRIAARLEDCVERLRRLTQSPERRERVLVYLTSANFNNAYVMPSIASIPQQMVMPAHVTLELFDLFGFGPAELGAVGCHEAVHYVQMQQVDGFWLALNTLTGGLFQPNTFTESWFLEGLATYYEGQLGEEQGRPHSPVWRGWFEAAVHARDGRLNPGHLSPEHRELEPFGGNYLVGMHFVEWLARTYGEDRLWALVDLQGESLVSPFAVTLRFERIYGRSIGMLFEQYTQALARALRPRKRPGTQEVLVREVGAFARMAASPAEGAIALVSSAREEPVRLTLRERDGRVRFSRTLTQLLPGRRWIATSPLVMSGLSFTGDGASLFLMAGDIDAEGSYIARLWQVDARTGEVVRLWEDLKGLGGSVTADGQAYVYVHVQGDTANLVRLDLSTGAHEPLTRFEGHQSIGTPAVSPDGARIAFSMRTGKGWNLALREPDGHVRLLTDDGSFNYAPRWVDAERLLFQREDAGRWQAHLLELKGGGLHRLTDAPHLVMDVAPLGDGHIAFLNREGVEFSLDRAPLAPLASGEALASAPTPGVEPGAMAPSPSPGAGAEAPATTPPAPEAAAHPLPPAGRELTLLSDEPYSPLEHFLVPELRAPYAYVLPDTEASNRPIVYGGLSLAGQDRLGFHQYALNLSYNARLRAPNLSVAYGNATLAPWYVQVGAARTASADRRDLRATLTATRTFWTTPVSLGLLALRRDYYATDRAPGTRTSIAGPEASINYFAGESTSYGGTQRGLGLSLDVGAYPLAFDAADPFGDVRAGVDTFLGGLPFLSRDNLQLSAVARALPGAPAGLLQVGGIPRGISLYSLREGPSDERSLPRELQPGMSFTEYLRGYDDFRLSARHVLMASARYRYRFIIDHGWASFLYLGPSFFIRQLELEAFGSWARTDLRANHRAAGGALTLHTQFWQTVPLALYYEFAARFDDGLGPLHMVGLSFQ